jgi:hypothetical protein
MFNESLSLLSLNELKDVLLFQLTILHVAHVYVLIYVVYKALGRYVYFKPQEHASKINRTLLTLSLLVVTVHSFSGLINYFPIFSEYRWLYIACGLVLISAVLSILVDRMIWKYDRQGWKTRRNWAHNYLPIPNDYYKTSVSKRETEGSLSHTWEEEGVESTRENIHSDALLNILALVTFFITIGRWTYDSVPSYGWRSFVFSLAASLSVGAIFFNQAVFSWVEYLQQKRR